MQARRGRRIGWTAGLLLLGVAALAPPGLSWGPVGHQNINRQAVRLLPEPMRSAFEAHLDVLIDNAVAADNRKGSDPDESQRHYMDMDHYGAYPFENIPHDLAQLRAEFGAATVKSNGILPWAIAATFDTLVAQIKAGDDAQWLTAADLGHYIGDAHMPLHTTKDFDGNDHMTRGLHARFEIAAVDFFWQEAYFDDRAEVFYAEDPLESAFDMLLPSYAQVEPLFAADRAAQQVGSKHEVIRQGYWQALWDLGAGEIMIERQNEAARQLASYWYTAWLAAGKPASGGAGGGPALVLLAAAALLGALLFFLKR